MSTAAESVEAMRERVIELLREALWFSAAESLACGSPASGVALRMSCEIAKVVACNFVAEGGDADLLREVEALACRELGCEGCSACVPGWRPQ